MTPQVSKKPIHILFAFFFVTLLLGNQNTMASMQMPIETEKMKLTVLIEKLKKRLSESTLPQQKVTELSGALARTYMVGYLEGNPKDVTVMKDVGEFRDKWQYGAFKKSSGPLPRKVATIQDSQRSQIVRGYLKEAIAYYEKYMKVVHPDAFSGYEYYWCLEQSGQIEKAVEGYRKIFKKAPELRSQNSAGQFVEIGNALVELLNKEKDQAEIQQIQNEMKRLQGLPFTP